MELKPNSIEGLEDELGFILSYETTKLKLVMTIEGICFAEENGETRLIKTWDEFLWDAIESHICGTCDKDFYHDSPNYIDEDPVCIKCWKDKYPDVEYGGIEVSTDRYEEDEEYEEGEEDEDAVGGNDYSCLESKNYDYLDEDEDEVVDETETFEDGGPPDQSGL